MLKTIISLTRWQKAIILFAVDVALVPLADAVTLLLLGVWPNVLLSRMWDHWPLVLATMAVAGALSVLSGLNRLRLKEYQGDAISRSLLMAVLIGAFYAALGQFLDMDMRIAFHVVFALVYFAGFFTARQVLVALPAQLASASCLAPAAIP